LAAGTQIPMPALPRKLAWLVIVAIPAVPLIITALVMRQCGDSAEAAARATLAPVSFPGLDISMPEWPQKEQQVLGARGQVVRKLGNNRGALHVEWSRSELFTREELLHLFGGIEELEELDPPVTTQASGVDVELLRLRNDADRFSLVVTNWTCPDSGLTVIASTTLRRPLTETEALARRVLATARCTALPDGLEILHAAFDVPNGFDLIEKGDTLIYASEEAGIGLPAVNPDVNLPAKLEKQGALRTQLAGTILEQPMSLTAPASREVGGAHRHYWAYSGLGIEDQLPARWLLSAWSCPHLEASFMAFYVGPGNADLEAASRLLDRASCPKRGGSDSVSLHETLELGGS
jgi:hypothetical protein